MDPGCKVFYLRINFYINFYNFALSQELQTGLQLQFRPKHKNKKPETNVIRSPMNKKSQVKFDIDRKH